ncbi:uncharacterized protein LOC135819635 [Sycon ciliatum]|uniref:uncharacterized protein LOC135819635 n=1 Tax=Sycon ciliatum TaxID=27933 RepID=UPI0031F6B95A
MSRNGTSSCSCEAILNTSMYSCIAMVAVVYVGAGLYALWKLRRHRKVLLLPLVFLIAGLFTAGLTCSVTCSVLAKIFCLMKVHMMLCKSYFFFLLGIAEAIFLLAVAVSHSYFNI